jgi:hypothetical protein
LKEDLARTSSAARRGSLFSADLGAVTHAPQEPVRPLITPAKIQRVQRAAEKQRAQGLAQHAAPCQEVETVEHLAMK